MSIWSYISSDFENVFQLHIYAWVTPEDDEDGIVIAEINTLTKEVTYLDERARDDKFAQEFIIEAIKELRETQRTS